MNKHIFIGFVSLVAVGCSPAQGLDGEWTRTEKDGYYNYSEEKAVVCETTSENLTINKDGTFTWIIEQVDPANDDCYQDVTATDTLNVTGTWSAWIFDGQDGRYVTFEQTHATEEYVEGDERDSWEDVGTYEFETGFALGKNAEGRFLQLVDFGLYNEI